MGAIALLALVLIFVAAGLIVERRMLRRLSSRSCTGRLWRRAFPTSTNEDIRQFLDIVHMSFGVGRRYRFRLPPNTKLLDLYRAVEPPVFSLGADAMEFETLAMEIQERYCVDLQQYWKDDLTLGDLFALTRSSGGSTSRGCEAADPR